MKSKRVDGLHLAPGSRVIVRDLEWIIRRVEPSSDGGQIIHCDGISELSQNKSAIFLTSLDKDIITLEPEATKLVHDSSHKYSHTILYVESLLRQVAPNTGHIQVAHKAAMDKVEYQLEPALQSLAQARQRILIADAVGLGKTLEAGILVSELAHRGRGKRILVLTLKSMLTQFQKEFWNRFSIPLTRLDSVGLQRVRNHIPTNHNPFHYYDKSIISIDTLKQDNEYRVYLEQAWWDIIIVDEAHNVANRNTGSQRTRLAELLAKRSDTLIMLSATPHDGRAKSFASLINMLDPTAIANNEDYTSQDFSNKGLVIRRFKKDIQQQVNSEFKERKTYSHKHDATLYEEAAYEALLKVKFTKSGHLDERHVFSLIRVTLQKALFSSPAACLDSVGKRISKLEKLNEDEYHDAIADEISDLIELKSCLENIPHTQFKKYLTLLDVIKNKMNWKPRDKTDRLVIFSERIETLHFLSSELKTALKLKDNQITILHGQLSDLDQQKIVEDFGKPESPLRILLCSDVASEGINLHYQCHRLIHFDMPWSLMVFQQRNGRIDRYGQEQEPEIHYLLTEVKNNTVRGDMRILEVLRDKDEQAYKNIGDPSAFMHVYDVKEEEKLTQNAMLEGTSSDEFDDKYQPKADLLSLFLGNSDTEQTDETPQLDCLAQITEQPSLFSGNYDYCCAALVALNNREKSKEIQFTTNNETRSIELTAPKDLEHRFKYFPREIAPKSNELLVLSEDKTLIKQEIARSREDESAWPKKHYLWEQSPVVQWINDRVLSAFGRHEAPVVQVKQGMEEGEAVFVVSGLIPNRKGHPLIHEWMCLSYLNGKLQKQETFSSLIERTKFGKEDIPNRGETLDPKRFKKLLPDVIKHTKKMMKQQRQKFRDEIEPKLKQHCNELQAMREQQHQQLELEFNKQTQIKEGQASKASIIRLSRQEQKKQEVNAAFDDYQKWMEDTMTTEDQPYINIICVLHNWIA